MLKLFRNVKTKLIVLNSIKILIFLIIVLLMFISVKNFYDSKTINKYFEKNNLNISDNNNNTEAINDYESYMSKEVNSLTSNLLIMIILGTITFLIIFISSTLIILSMAKKIKTISTALSRLEEGNLNIDITTRTKDEFGLLNNKLNSVSNNINKLLIEVKGSSEEVINSGNDINYRINNIAAAIQEIQHSIDQISHGANSQYEDVKAINKDINESSFELKSMSNRINEQFEVIMSNYELIKQVSEKIDQSFKSINEAKSKASSLTVISEEGSESLQKIIGGIDEIRKTSDDVKNIIAVIEDIASQDKYSRL